MFLKNITSEVIQVIRQSKFDNIKLQLNLQVEFYKFKLGSEKIYNTGWFNSNRFIELSRNHINLNTIKRLYDNLIHRIEEFTNNSSGWILNKLLNFTIKIVEYKPLRGSSYIELPEKLRNPKYKLINIKNQDNMCFKWTVARHFCRDEKNGNRITKILKKKAEELDFADINFPMKIKDIDKFEKINNISINVYSLNYCLELCPLRITKTKNKDVVSLLLITNENGCHYVLMRSLSPFINKASHRTKYVCPYCLHAFIREDLLDKHKDDCSVHTPVKYVYSDEKLKFKAFQKTIKHPFVIYADFESTLVGIDSSQPDPKSNYTRNIQKHEPNSFCCYTKCEDDRYSKLELYNGEDASEKFVEYLEAETKRVYELLNQYPKKMFLSNEKYYEHRNATVCYVCHEEFTKENYKVRDHNHLTGDYRGPAHLKCNFKIRNPNFIPVFMHNLSNYDSHLFVKELGKVSGKINAIPETDQKYISFTQTIKVGTYIDRNTGRQRDITRDLRFLDTFRFMSSSLDALSKNLSEHMELKRHFPNNEQFKLIQNKGIYPYDYMDTYDKMNSISLPSKDEFYNKLNDKHISDKEYGHAKEVWDVFKCKTFKDYHNLYLKVDTLLLSEVFENFRNTCLKTYKLDPAHYFTAPGLSFDALLKITEIELDLLNDPDMILFIEKGIRGGVSMISKRYARANNKYIPESYDPQKPSNYISYMDANNLYGWAMSQSLPTGNFRWLKENEPFKHNKGYILEVDFSYPEDLHDNHNDLPLAPENIKIGDVHKLVPHLGKREKYVIHNSNLKLYEKLGLKLEKIHRILEFDESPWMKPYIDLNTKKRQQATSDFDKDFFKLMNNSVFGKTMENIRNRVEVNLVKTKQELGRLVNKPNFKGFKIFSENLIACHMQKQKLKFDKPIYVGMSILDISKTLMYDFHYNFIREKYGDRAKLLFTDTDSLCYDLRTDDLYKDMKDNQDLFDTSNYPKDHFLYSNQNKKVIGKMKDETSSIPIEEFVGLRAKLYCYRTKCSVAKRAKGIKRNVIERNTTMDEYKRALNNETIYKTMYNIQSDNHELYTKEINKIALNGDDDKRHILADGINTLALNHCNAK